MVAIVIGYFVALFFGNNFNEVHSIPDDLYFDEFVYLRRNLYPSFFWLVTAHDVEGRVVVHLDDPWFESPVNEDIEAQHLEAIAFHCIEVTAKEYFLSSLSEGLERN